MELALADANLARCAAAIDPGTDAVFGERVAHHPERGRQRVAQIDVLAVHAGGAEHLFVAHQVRNAPGRVAHPLDGRLQRCLPGGVTGGQRDQERDGFLPLRVVPEVREPVLPVGAHGVGQRGQTAPEPVVGEGLAQGLDAGGHAGDRVANVVHDGVDDLQAAFRERLRQRFRRERPRRHVTEYDHPALDAADIVQQRSGAHPDVDPVRALRVANEDVLLVDRLALVDGAQEGKFLGRDRRFPIRVVGAVVLRPLIRRPVRNAHADDLLGGGIHVQEVAVRVGHHDAVADAPERGVDQIVLIAQLGHGLAELLSSRLLLGDVAIHDHAAAGVGFIAAQRPAADADEHPVGLVLVADEQLDVIGRLAVDGALQREVAGFDAGGAVRQESAVRRRPLLGVHQLADADDPFRARVEHAERAARVGHHHRVADAVEDRLHEVRALLELPQPLFGLQRALGAFACVHGQGDRDGQLKLRLTERRLQTAERTAVRHQLQHVSGGRLGRIGDQHDGYVVLAAEQLRRAPAGRRRLECERDQHQIRLGLLRHRERLLRARHYPAHLVSDVAQTLRQPGAAVTAVDNQNRRHGTGTNRWRHRNRRLPDSPSVCSGGAG